MYGLLDSPHVIMGVKMNGLLDRKSRVERLREIVQMVKDEKSFSAFDLAVKYDISINVVYRDIRALREGSHIPKDFALARKGT